MANNLILEKLQGVKARFIEVGKMLTDQSIMSDMDKYVKLNKEYKDLEPIIEAYDEYTNIISNIDNAKSILATEKDEEMREMAKMEIDELTAKVDPMEDCMAVTEVLPATGANVRHQTKPSLSCRCPRQRKGKHRVCL